MNYDKDEIEILFDEVPPEPVDTIKDVMPDCSLAAIHLVKE